MLSKYIVFFVFFFPPNLQIKELHLRDILYNVCKPAVIFFFIAVCVDNIYIVKEGTNGG